MKLRYLLFGAAVLAIGFLIYRNIGQFDEFMKLLGQLNLYALVFIIPIRYFSYWSNMRYFASFLSLYGHKVERRRLFKSIVTMNFVNTVFPTGGISGVSYITNALKPKIDSHTTAIAQIFYQVFTLAGYFIFLFVAFLSLFVANSSDKISSKMVLLFILGLLTLGVVAITIASQRATAEKVLYWATRPLNVVLKFFKRNALSKEKIEQFVEDFYGSIARMRKNKDRVWAPFGWAMAGLFFEVLSIYIVFFAFGKLVNPGVVIAAYSLALLVSPLSFFTAGVGLYEATMVATFVALGQPLGLSLSVTLVYRMIAFWLFLPVGLYFYHKETLDTVDGQ